MPQTGSMTSRTNSMTTKPSTRRSVRVIMLDKEELIIRIEVCGSVLDIYSIHRVSQNVKPPNFGSNFVKYGNNESQHSAVKYDIIHVSQGSVATH